MIKIQTGETNAVAGSNAKQIREETTNSVARAITREETDARQALTAKLKAERLEREMVSPTPRPAKRMLKRKPPLRRY